MARSCAGIHVTKSRASYGDFRFEEMGVALEAQQAPCQHEKALFGATSQCVDDLTRSLRANNYALVLITQNSYSLRIYADRQVCGPVHGVVVQIAMLTGLSVGQPDFRHLVGTGKRESHVHRGVLHAPGIHISLGAPARFAHLDSKKTGFFD